MKKITLITLFFIMAMSQHAVAQLIVMDTTFGQYKTGAVRTYFRNNEDELNSLMNYAYYNYVAGSTQKYDGNWDFVFAGFYETEYSYPQDQGRTYIDFNGGNDHAMALCKGAGNYSGRVYLAGYTTNASGVSSFALARVTGSGDADVTFGDDAKVTVSFGNTDDKAFAVVAQPDGKIIVAGYTTTATGRDFALVRYNDLGQIDTTFGTNGKVITDFNGADDEAHAIVVLSTGKILVGGWATLNGQADFAVARYTAAGVLDTTFHTTGKLTTDVSGGNDRINAFVTDATTDATYAAGAATTTGGTLDFALLKYNAAGLDVTFDTDGIVTTPIGSSDEEAYSIYRNNNGIWLSGYTKDGAFKSAAVIKYNGISGFVQTGFGNNGIIVQDIGPGDDVSRGVVVKDDDNDVYIAGTGFNGCDNDSFVTGYKSSGEIYDEYGIHGKWMTDFDFADSFSLAIAIQPDYKIVQVGSTNTYKKYLNTYYTDFAITRYNADGSPDNGLGGCGRIVTPMPGTSNTFSCVALQPDNKIVAGGTIGNTGAENYFIARYNTDGSLDNSFGNGGTLTITASGTSLYIDKIAILPDGKILAYAGKSTSATRIMKFNADGSFDTSFGSNGMVDVNMINSGNATVLAVQPDGKFIIGNYKTYTFAIARYNANGTIDTSFGTSGVVTATFSSASSSLYSMVLQPDGKILLGGTTGRNVVVVRYNTDGTPDTTFSGDGFYYAGSNSTYLYNSGYLVLQPDNKIVIGVSDDALVLERINGDGTIDTTFDTGQILDFYMDYSGIDHMYGLGLQNGKVIMAGSSSSLLDNAFTLARFDVGLAAGTDSFNLESHNAIKAYPNPVTDSVTLDFNLINGGAGTISLYDIMGKKIAVLAKDKTFTSGNNTEKLMLPAGLATGVYIISLNVENISQSVKIIK